jgi:hypothetical protein
VERGREGGKEVEGGRKERGRKSENERVEEKKGRETEMVHGRARAPSRQLRQTMRVASNEARRG